MTLISGYPRPFAVALILLTGLSRALAVTLDDCIAVALEHNPDVRAATERVRAANAAIEEARSAYYPRLGSSATYARTDNPPQAFMMSLNQRSASLQSDFNNPDDTDNVALSLGAKYCLYDFGRRELDSDMALVGSHAARSVLRALQNELIHQVTRGYFAVLQAKAFEAVQEETLATLRESLRVANERLKAGGAVRTDVLNLEVQLAQAREEQIRARNGVKLSLAALNTAMGVDTVNADNLPVPVAPPPDRPAETEDSSVLQTRPELAAARDMAEIGRMAHQKALRQYRPTVNAFGSVDWNGDASSEFENSYIVGVVAELELFDGFRRRASAAGAAAREDAALAEADKTENALRLDLTTAVLQAGEAWERLDVARKSIENAEEALRITQQRYEQGAADLSELLTAQVGLTGTRTRNVAALYDLLSAHSNLERAKGRLVSRYVQPFKQLVGR